MRPAAEDGWYKDELVARAGQGLAQHAEECLIIELRKSDARAEHFSLLDEKFMVDILVECGETAAGPHPRAEIQATLDFDNRSKLGAYARARPFTRSEPVIRVYVELWAPYYAPQAATALMDLLRSERADGTAYFLRVGPDGKVVTMPLATKLRLLDDLADLRHPRRQRGLLVALDVRHATILSGNGRTVRIPLRCLLDRTRWNLRKCADRNEMPPSTRISYLPGVPDESGFPQFCGIAVDLDRAA